MKTIDLKSILIGALITLLFLSIFGFRPETDELGHLVVKSITIEENKTQFMYTKFSWEKKYIPLPLPYLQYQHHYT